MRKPLICIVTASLALLFATSPAGASDVSPEPELQLSPPVQISQPNYGIFASDSARVAETTQSFNGSFKASVRSANFFTSTESTIRVKVTPTGCSAAYPFIKVRLFNVSIATKSWEVPSAFTVVCNTTTTVNFRGTGQGLFQVQFDRTGPSGKDEGTKSVTGTIYHAP